MSTPALPTKMPDGRAVSAARCPNCDALIAGSFCGSCGQRAGSRSLSLGNLLQEGVGDVYDLDSRLWRTLRLLLFRPGELTLDYLAGRRQRYVPPFRLYLVASLLLFLFTPDVNDIDVMPVQFDTPAMVQKTIDATNAALVAKRAEVARLGASEARSEAIADLEVDLNALTVELWAANTAASKADTTCDRVQFDFFSSKRLEPRLRTACHKIEADHGKGLFAAFLHNLPKMMFLFLPLVALFNKILYIRSRRYYVEHLLFFVHLHVFIFLMFVFIMLGNRVFALVPGGVNPPGVVTFLVVVGILSYVYMALRRFYGQGRAKTFIKFGFLLAAYSITLAVTTLTTMAYSALTL